ncbi:MAG: LemA family protein [Acidimicrobiia bacterium]|nr:LemA family protein [Acidimicrobiia bacterium]
MVWIVVVVLVAVVVGLAAFLVVIYNGLVRRRNLVHDAWAGIDVQLTRRADLVPNLVEVVGAYAGHERATLEDVTRARTETVDAAEPRSAEQAANHLDGSLQRLVAVAEAYPDLKANENFLDLQAQLGQIEEDISFARRYYNASARKYNDSQQTFPAVLVARPFGHQAAPYFQADAEARSTPSVG